MVETNNFVKRVLEQTIDRDIKIKSFKKKYWSDCTSWKYSLEIEYNGVNLYILHWPFGVEESDIDSIRKKVYTDILDYEMVMDKGTDEELASYIYNVFQYKYSYGFFYNSKIKEGWVEVRRLISPYILNYKEKLNQKPSFNEIYKYCLENFRQDYFQ